MRLKVGIVSLWCLAIFSGFFMDSAHQSLLSWSDQPRTRSDVLLDVVGEFRTILARYLWFKMDLYHEVLDTQSVASERQTEVIPLLRMVSLLDPSIVESYDNLAWDLYKGQEESQQALSILDEGIQRNPDSFQLHFRAAGILYHTKSFKSALDFAQKAAPLAEGEFEQLDAYRLIYWSSKELKERTVMRDALRHLLALRPGDSLWSKEMADLDATEQDVSSQD